MRKRGITALLSDTPSFEAHSERGSALVAREFIKSISARKAPRGISSHAVAVPSASATLAQTRACYRRKADVCDPDTLQHIIKSRPEVLERGQDIIYKYIERSGRFTLQKAMALNIFSVSVMEGSGIIQACNLASKITGFSPQVVRRWADAVFLGFFATTANIDDVDDDVMESELESSRGKFSKWESLLDSEGFRLEATQFVRKHGYVKGAPNLTLADFVQWVSEKWDVQIHTETARVWLHQMGFSYRQFSKGIYFDGHEREDVVQHRTEYLATLASLENRMLTSQDQLPQSLSLTPSHPLPECSMTSQPFL